MRNPKQAKNMLTCFLTQLSFSLFLLSAFLIDINNQLTFFNVEFDLTKLEAAMIEFSVIYVTKTSHSIS